MIHFTYNDNVCVGMSVCMHACAFVCMHMCMNVCVCVYACAWMHTMQCVCVFMTEILPPTNLN